jgi:hypothetical protein
MRNPGRKTWAIIAVVVVLLALGLWMLFRSSAHDYRVTLLSAHTWEIPALGYTVRGTSDTWTMKGMDGNVHLAVRSGKITRGGSYLLSSCGVGQGSPAHWAWLPHTNHHKATVEVGYCEIDLQRVAKSRQH